MVLVGLVAFCFLATPGWTRGNQTPCFMTQQAWQSRSVKPDSVQLSAIVFYGRRHHVRVLDKYLKQNLVSVGGLLQEVLWFVHTEDHEDIHWLNQTLLPSEPHYYKAATSGDFASFYRELEDSRYYIKFDDDIMYIRRGTIEAMLHEKLQERYWMVSANVINHPVLSHVHASLGALQTYKQQGREFVLGNSSFLEGSPFMSMDSNPHGDCALESMECAAISHYNFLANIDKEGGLDKYNFGTWDFNAFNGYPRWSINTFIFKGSDLNKEEILADDEKSIAVLLPEIKKVHSGAVGKAIVVHLSYKPQRVDGLEQQTNVAAHYVALARKLTGPLLDV